MNSPLRLRNSRGPGAAFYSESIGLTTPAVHPANVRRVPRLTCPGVLTTIEGAAPPDVVEDVVKGVKKGQTILLDREPAVPDGTEVEIVLPTEWEAQRSSLLSVGYHPEFGRDVEEAQRAWKPPEF